MSDPFFFFFDQRTLTLAPLVMMRPTELRWKEWQIGHLNPRETLLQWPVGSLRIRKKKKKKKKKIKPERVADLSRGGVDSHKDSDVIIDRKCKHGDDVALVPLSSDANKGDQCFFFFFFCVDSLVGMEFNRIQKDSQGLWKIRLMSDRGYWNKRKGVEISKQLRGKIHLGEGDWRTWPSKTRDNCHTARPYQWQ